MKTSNQLVGAIDITVQTFNRDYCKI